MYNLAMNMSSDYEASHEGQKLVLIDDPVTADQVLRTTFLKPLNTQALINEIYQREEEKIRQYAKDHPYLALVLRKEKEPAKPGLVSPVIVATTSNNKRQIIEAVATKLELDIQQVTEDQLGSEKKLSKTLKPLKGDERIYYAIDLAEMKIYEPSKHYLDNPIITMDTVVIDEKGNVLEKPSGSDNYQQAKEMISTISGQTISIVTGLALVDRLPSGQRMIIREGIVVTMKVRLFSPSEIEYYLKVMKGNIKDIAGAIDFSSSIGKNFIDGSIPLKVRSIILSGKSVLGSSDVELSKSATSVLDSYFIGAPIHPIEAMLTQLKQMHQDLSSHNP